jgi:hypothetical protein
MPTHAQGMGVIEYNTLPLLLIAFPFSFFSPTLPSLSHTHSLSPYTTLRYKAASTSRSTARTETSAPLMGAILMVFFNFFLFLFCFVLLYLLLLRFYFNFNFNF